jgi:putative zinc finger/helix-turn-helix YgiT family protein
MSRKDIKQKREGKPRNIEYLTGEDIKRIRKKLGLTQEGMAEKLGVGLKTFARYENLSVRQSKAMDNLLRILDKYPESIEIIEKTRL